MDRRRIENAAGTVQLVTENLGAVGNLLPRTMVDPGELDRVARLLEVLADALKLVDIRRKLRQIDEDVYGAYFFNVPKIEVYWMAIGIAAP